MSTHPPLLKMPLLFVGHGSPVNAIEFGGVSMRAVFFNRPFVPLSGLRCPGYPVVHGPYGR
jgi:hypothetical protein